MKTIQFKTAIASTDGSIQAGERFSVTDEHAAIFADGIRAEIIDDELGRGADLPAWLIEGAVTEAQTSTPSIAAAVVIDSDQLGEDGDLLAGADEQLGEVLYPDGTTGNVLVVAGEGAGEGEAKAEDVAGEGAGEGEAKAEDVAGEGAGEGETKTPARKQYGKPRQ